MSEEGPTRRSLGRFRDEDVGFDQELPPDAAFIPWIDIHQHGHEGSWNTRHEFDISGGLATVMVSNAAHSAPYRPMTASDLQFLWDSTLRRSHAISRSHFFDAYVAVGIHTTRTQTKNYEELLDILPAYTELEKVVAIGEIGISLNTVQVAEPWTLDEQKEVVASQMEIARDTDTPVLIHTPKVMKREGDKFVRGKTEGGHNLSVSNDLPAEQTLNPETAKIDAVQMDIELADQVGISDELLVVDHAEEEIVPFVMDNTNCYLGFTLYGHPEDNHPDIEVVADTIEEYGPDRIVIDTDTGGVAEHRPFALKEIILDLLRLDIPPEDVRQVVYENPREILGLDYLPE